MWLGRAGEKHCALARTADCQLGKGSREAVNLSNAADQEAGISSARFSEHISPVQSALQLGYRVLRVAVDSSRKRRLRGPIFVRSVQAARNQSVRGKLGRRLMRLTMDDQSCAEENHERSQA